MRLLTWLSLLVLGSVYALHDAEMKRLYRNRRQDSRRKPVFRFTNRIRTRGEGTLPERMSSGERAMHFPQARPMHLDGFGFDKNKKIHDGEIPGIKNAINGRQGVSKHDGAIKHVQRPLKLNPSAKQVFPAFRKRVSTNSPMRSFINVGAVTRPTPKATTRTIVIHTTEPPTIAFRAFTTTPKTTVATPQTTPPHRRNQGQFTMRRKIVHAPKKTTPRRTTKTTTTTTATTTTRRRTTTTTTTTTTARPTTTTTTIRPTKTTRRKTTTTIRPTTTTRRKTTTTHRPSRVTTTTTATTTRLTTPHRRSQGRFSRPQTTIATTRPPTQKIQVHRIKTAPSTDRAPLRVHSKNGESSRAKTGSHVENVHRSSGGSQSHKRKEMVRREPSTSKRPATTQAPETTTRPRLTTTPKQLTVSIATTTAPSSNSMKRPTVMRKRTKKIRVDSKTSHPSRTTSKKNFKMIAVEPSLKKEESGLQQEFKREQPIRVKNRHERQHIDKGESRHKSEPSRKERTVPRSRFSSSTIHRSHGQRMFRRVYSDQTLRSEPLPNAHFIYQRRIVHMRPATQRN